MARIQIAGAPYGSKAAIASGQECVNLYAELNEANDPQAPSMYTYYPFAGTDLYAAPIPANPNTVRGEYRTSIGTAYVVIGGKLYTIVNDNLVLIGSIADLPSQVYFSDNGIVCVFVDGENGYVVDMTTNELGIIIDPNFYGADWIALLDTFFCFNRPLTNQFYITGSNVNYGQLTNTAILNGTITTPGAGYTNGTYSEVPLTGGSGTGATAEITVTGGVVTTVLVDSGGQNYTLGDVLSADTANIGGTGAGFVFTVNQMDSAFDPLDIAAKSGFNDPIVGIVAIHRELWLIGALTTEIWIGTGAADFYFQEVQGSYINHGCLAKYSIATADVVVFFLHQDLQGSCKVMMGQGYDITEVSTPRIVSEFKKYAKSSLASDAIGMCFQLEDHDYYAIVFPTANKGWIYDITTSSQGTAKFWYEWNATDINGNLNRPRANCAMFYNGKNIVGDFENGNLLQLDINSNFDVTSEGSFSIQRIRTFPHSVDQNERVSYRYFEADMQTGNVPEGEIAYISLSWSDDKGLTYNDPIIQEFSQIGQTDLVPTWWQLGMARDRVFKLSWNSDMITALNGGFTDTRASRS